MELVAAGSADYEVIDSGRELKLERLGPVVLSRQCAQAFWRPAIDDWGPLVHAAHYRHDQGPGEWTFRRKVPESWDVRIEELTFEVRLTQFGHVGFFAEQQAQWPWIRETAGDGASVLNLFAYTGGSTLAALSGGARVTHVDAAPGVVDWARRCAEKSGFPKGARWIVDDAVKFVRRELRRGTRYDAVILDPPTFGRGPQGSVWKIEQDLVPLIDDLDGLLSTSPRFVLLSAHTPGVTSSVLRNLLRPLLRRRGGHIVDGEMVHRQARSEDVLAAGVYARWVP